MQLVAQDYQNYRDTAASSTPVSNALGPVWGWKVLSDVTYERDMAMRFTLAGGIPKGSIIDSAAFSMVANNTREFADSIKLHCYGVRGPIPPDLVAPWDWPPTTAEEVLTYTAWLEGTTYTYSNLAAVLQELVDELADGEWLTEWCLLFFTEEVGAADVGLQYVVWDWYSSSRPVLNLTYRVAPVWTEGGKAGDTWDGAVRIRVLAEWSEGGQGGELLVGRVPSASATSWGEGGKAGDTWAPWVSPTTAVSTSDGTIGRDTFEPRVLAIYAVPLAATALAGEAYDATLVPIHGVAGTDGAKAGDAMDVAMTREAAWSEGAKAGDTSGSVPAFVTITDVVLVTPFVANPELRTP